MSGWRARIGSALADGWRFASLHAAAGGAVVRVVLARELSLDDVRKVTAGTARAKRSGVMA